MAFFQIHPFAEVFPLLADSEFRRLVINLKEAKQSEPIWVFQDQIIDDRNRYYALREINCEVDAREWSGQGSLLSFILSRNYRFTGLPEPQRAMIAAKLANLQRSYNDSIKYIRSASPLTDSEIINSMQISQGTFAKAKRILNDGVFDLGDSIDSEESFHEAEKTSSLPKGNQVRLGKSRQRRSSLKDLATELLARNVRSTHRKTGSVCVICNPELPAGEDEFVTHLAGLRSRLPIFSRYLDPILLEIGEMNLTEPIREASGKIFAAIDHGLLEKRQIKAKTNLPDEILDATLSHLVDFGELVLLPQNKITEQARGQKKWLYRRPETTDPNLKASCNECGKTVGSNYKKIDFDTFLCKSCVREEEAARKASIKRDPTVVRRDFREVLGKYGYRDLRNRLLVDYPNFQEVMKNEDGFIDPNGNPLDKFIVYRGLKREALDEA